MSLNFFSIVPYCSALRCIGINIAIGDSTKSASDFVNSKEASPLQEAELVYRKIVIPLAMPLLVGPGVIANVVLYATEVESHNNNTLFFGLVGTIIGLSIVIFAILLSGRWLQKMVGSVGLNILTRILGLLVSSMGVQFMITGLSNIIVHSLMPEILKVH